MQAKAEIDLARAIGAAVALTLGGAQGAFALEIVQASFASELDLPYYGGSKGPRVLLNADQTLPHAGYALDEGDEISNPSEWYESLQVDFDPATGILTLTPTASDVYETISVTMFDILFDAPGTITGFTALSTGGAIDDTVDTFDMTLAQTADSVTVSYSIAEGSGQSLNLSGDGEDRFLVSFAESGTPVPVPAAAPLLAAAVGALVLYRRRG